jgi:hypothetical protein
LTNVKFERQRRRKEIFMSKYNQYAKRLDEAFRSARDEYAAAYNALAKAEQAKNDVGGWRPEKVIGEHAAKEARATAELFDAKTAFDSVRSRVWDSFNAQRAEIRAELAAEIKRDNMASPDAIDNNGLELLKSGILTPDELEALAVKYDTNPTMLRMVGKFAAEALKATADTQERAKLYAVTEAAKNGQNATLRAFDTLSTVADTCSGIRSNGKLSEPGYTVAIGAKWEELSGEAVANF